MGSSALLFQAPGALDLANQRRIWALARQVADWPGIREAASGMSNLLVIFDAQSCDPEALQVRLISTWPAVNDTPEEGRLVELPVIYGGELGDDLGLVADRAGMTPRETAQLHAATDYVVFAPGSSPGFGYLFGLDPRLFTPRKNEPVMRKQTGTIAIGGIQTSIGAAAGPSGWNAIGCLSEPLVPFDPHRDPPSVLYPGDRVRFRIEAIVA